MDPRRVLRDLAAVIVIVAACPAALFGGALMSCASTGLTADCAVRGFVVSPFLLAGAGLVAGLLTRGWKGLGLMFVGVVVGMATLAIVAGLVGDPVPIDPIQGVIAAIWFGFPVAVGYGVGRGAARLLASRE